MIPVALLVTIGVFALARLSPVDPVLVFAGEERDPAMLEAIRHQLGLDQPLPVQYVAWLTHALQGDLGRSFQNHQRVLEAITERLPATIELSLMAIVIALVVGLPLGIFSALYRDGPIDHLARHLARRRVVEIDERLAIDLELEDREVGADALDVVYQRRLRSRCALEGGHGWRVVWARSVASSSRRREATGMRSMISAPNA